MSGLQTTNAAPSDFMVISQTEDGYRVFQAGAPKYQYFVSGNLDDLACTCNAFADDQTCEHTRAVYSQTERKIGEEERQAIQAESLTQPQGRKRNAPKTASAATLTLKRSVSPDGRIDSLSVELSCPIDQKSKGDIKARAADMLNLQGEITRGFLSGTRNGNKGTSNGNGTDGQGSRPTITSNGNGHGSTQHGNGPIPATMLAVGSTNGRHGPSLYISFQAEGFPALKLFGSAADLVGALWDAGYRYAEHELKEGVRLNHPCRVTTKPSTNGRYINVDRVLPQNGNQPDRRRTQ